jgi:hypothetical protein
MAKVADTFLDRLRHRSTVAGWRRCADRAARIDAERLSLLRGRAIELRRHIDRLVHAADARLEQADAPDRTDRPPPGSDWSWRPDVWQGRLPVPGLASVAPATAFGETLRLFHDCPHHEVGLRQRRNPGGEGLPPFALDLDVFGFEGSFLSLALDLPPEAALGLGPRHLIRLEIRAEAERPLSLYVRLNLRQGPNVEPLVRHVRLDRDWLRVEFDLAPAGPDARRIDAIWLDLILEAPRMNRVTLRDLWLCRRPRADL